MTRALAVFSRWQRSATATIAERAGKLVTSKTLDRRIGRTFARHLASHKDTLYTDPKSEQNTHRCPMLFASLCSFIHGHQREDVGGRIVPSGEMMPSRIRSHSSAGTRSDEGRSCSRSASATVTGGGTPRRDAHSSALVRYRS